MPRQSSGEKKFLDAWEGRPAPCQQYPFTGGWTEFERIYKHKPALPRRWRFDAAFPEYKVAIEIDGVGKGGSVGRHQRPGGMAKDNEKANAAVAEGWAVIRLTTSQITRHNLWLIKELLIRRGMPAELFDEKEAA